jgi:hypothetical protein
VVASAAATTDALGRSQREPAGGSLTPGSSRGGATARGLQRPFRQAKATARSARPTRPLERELRYRRLLLLAPSSSGRGRAHSASAGGGLVKALRRNTFVRSRQ